MTRLNQIVALEKGLKGRTQDKITKLHHLLQKRELFSGFSRIYTPKDEEGEQFPPEGTHIQQRVDDHLKDASAALTQLFDVVATKEWGNVVAKADVVVNGKVLVAQAPVPYLLFLEKSLVDWRTFVTKLPVLDPAEVWTYDADNSRNRTELKKSFKTKKVPKSMIAAPATDRHPAQVHLYNEDVTIGWWEKTDFSSAIPARERDLLVERANVLIDAVKSAREAANNTEITQQKVAQKLFDFLML